MSNSNKDAELKKLKASAAKINKDNYIVIAFSYGQHFVFPYKVGIAMLESFRLAETYDKSDYENPIITPFSEKFDVSIIPYEEYLALKVKHLLIKSQEVP